MAKRKQITVYLNTGADNETILSTYKGIQANVYFLEDKDGHGFHYNVCYGVYWDSEVFDSELDAIKQVCRKRFGDKYETIVLRHGNYSNSERGFVRGWIDGKITIKM